MIDWNNDGDIDAEDWFLTEMLLDEEDENEKRPEKPNGSCLTTMLLTLAFPICIIILGLTI